MILEGLCAVDDGSDRCDFEVDDDCSEHTYTFTASVSRRKAGGPRRPSSLADRSQGQFVEIDLRRGRLVGGDQVAEPGREDGAGQSNGQSAADENGSQAK